MDWSNNWQLQLRLCRCRPNSTLSRGNVTITSTDTNVAPVIDLNWLTYLADVEVALATFKRTRQVWAPLNITIGDEYLPGPSVTSYVDTLDFIRNVPCERDMGKSSNSMAVVDSTARVFGVQNLRVVDTIILPTLATRSSAVYLLHDCGEDCGWYTGRPVVLKWSLVIMDRLYIMMWKVFPVSLLCLLKKLPPLSRRILSSALFS
jgi:GMC oxidoreductase